MSGSVVVRRAKTTCATASKIGGRHPKAPGKIY